jgi:DNA-binding transcriptional LysR family regulator
MFDFHHMHVFVNVVQQKSFSKAAEAIFLSQSTVSAHIQTLEKELNVKLFDRMGKEVVLTSAGEKLYSWSLELLAVREKALHDINMHFSKMQGTIKIIASTVPGQYIVPGLIENFKNKYFEVMFEVFQSDSEDVAKSILSSKYDIGFMGVIIDKEKLQYVPIEEDRLILIAPKNFKKEARTIEVEDLLAEDMIIRNQGSGTQKVLENALRKRGLTLKRSKIVASFDTTEAVKQSVKSGLGIAVVSKRSAVDYIESGFVKAFEIKGLDLFRKFYLVYHKDRTLSPVSEKFIESIENKV